MAPHCDTLDGPVVRAAQEALKTGNVNYILPWVHKDEEKELKKAFERTAKELSKNPKNDISQIWFFETAVRLHRLGEGASYTGLKPAGLDWGPVVKKCEQALETGNATQIINFITRTVKNDLTHRFKKAMSLRKYNVNNVEAARKYIHSSVHNFVLYSHHLYSFVKGGHKH